VKSSLIITLIVAILLISSSICLIFYTESSDDLTETQFEIVNYTNSFNDYDLSVITDNRGVRIDLTKNEEKIVSIENFSYTEKDLPGIWEETFYAKEVESIRERSDGFDLTLLTNEKVIYTNATFVEDSIWINCTRYGTKDENEMISLSFSSDCLWYGQGSLLNQTFPLRNVTLLPLEDILKRVLPEFFLPAVNGALPFLYGKTLPLVMHFAPSFIATMGLDNNLMITRPLGYNFQTPFWLSSKNFGIFLNTTLPIEYTIRNGTLNLGIENNFYSTKIILKDNPLDVYKDFVEIVGMPEKVCPQDVFKEPIWTIGSQYSTNFDQEKILDYAQKIVENGLPRSVITIDVGWQKEHGDTEFDEKRFPDPKAMVDELHSMGFKVILWMVPYISLTSSNYGEARANDYLIKDEWSNLPILIPWSFVTQIAFDVTQFNIYSAARGVTKPLCSAVIDLSNPEALDWYRNKLNKLVEEYGIDGFKCDQGEGAFLPKEESTHRKITPNEYTDLCTDLGKDFDYYEIRTGWFSQHHGGWVREYDKFSSWDQYNGLKSTVTEALTLSIIGYPYILPDAVGGGQFFEDDELDEELYIRWVEVAAFMPIMQFPSSYFQQSGESKAIAKRYMELHKELSSYIIDLAKKAKEEGLPIVRPLFFHHKDQECFLINDEYLLGEALLVAPILEKGARSREVYLPDGTWIDFWSGDKIEGGQWIDYPAQLDEIPVFVREDLVDSIQVNFDEIRVNV